MWWYFGLSRTVYWQPRLQWRFWEVWTITRTLIKKRLFKIQPLIFPLCDRQSWEFPRITCVLWSVNAAFHQNKSKPKIPILLITTKKTSKTPLKFFPNSNTRMITSKKLLIKVNNLWRFEKYWMQLKNNLHLQYKSPTGYLVRIR